MVDPARGRRSLRRARRGQARRVSPSAFIASSSRSRVRASRTNASDDATKRSFPRTTSLRRPRSISAAREVFVSAGVLCSHVVPRRVRRERHDVRSDGAIALRRWLRRTSRGSVARLARERVSASRCPRTLRRATRTRSSARARATEPGQQPQSRKGTVSLITASRLPGRTTCSGASRSVVPSSSMSPADVGASS